MSDWNGEGLPPVGTVCAAPTAYGYMLCKVVDHGSNYVVVHFYPNAHGVKVDWTVGGCRPIRTAEEVAVEAIYREAHLEGCVNFTIAMAQANYAAIASGKIPGVKLEEGS